MFLVIISICTISFLKIDGYELPLLGKIIYLDAGHGGVDVGANYKNIYEKDINLSIVKILASKLENMGATVYLTRYGDYDLSNVGVRYRKRSDLYNRAKVINNSTADIYISIHLNSTTSSVWSGAQVFYDDVNNDNIILANFLKESIGTKREVVEISDMYFNRLVKIPGVLVEVGFLSNSYDRNNLINLDYQEKISDKIIDGIINYFTM
jgi:N-acetylmuramoyl-L-alanine amidase